MSGIDGVALDELTVAELVALAGNDERLAAFERAGEHCGWCAEPVRLASTTKSVDPATGELTESHGTYYKACGTRRKTRCPACAERYRRDARSIVLSGLQGGKGVSEEVADAPAILATLTAPSFGAVHRVRHHNERAVACRPGTGKTCVHGRSICCNEIHGERDGLVGQALCPDCYDYERSVVWNALAPELWRRTTIYLRRNLARAAGLSETAFRACCRLSFVKVAEYQRRGVVHLHVVARLDALEGHELPEALDVVALMTGFAAAARAVAVAHPGSLEDKARFGDQLDVKALVQGLERRAGGVAGYLAKYSIKSSDDNGALDRRLRSLDELRRKNLNDHLRRPAETAWRLAKRPELATLGVRRFAHALGFRGHWLTKSRAWSTTFAALRAERAAWRNARDEVEDSTTVTLERFWQFQSRGWNDAGESLLAASRERDQATARRERLLELTTIRRGEVAA